MNKRNDFLKQTDAMLTDWCGAKGYARLKAVAPGAATGELIEKLRTADKRDWYAICCQHANERAEDMCWYAKPGDLFYQDGSYFWCMFSMEIWNALRAVGAGRVRRRKAYDMAKGSFIESAERVRTLRIGSPEERKAKEEAGFDGIEFSETFGEYYERKQKEGKHHD
jgi:hypothetical protein